MDTKQAFVMPSAELAPIKEYPPIQFVNVKQMSEMVEHRTSELNQKLKRSVYMPFEKVRPADFVAIEKHRERTGDLRTSPILKRLSSKSPLRSTKKHMLPCKL
jgi:hypothetical protein